MEQIEDIDVPEVEKMTVRTLVFRATTPEATLREMQKRDAKRKPGDPPPFPIVYTGRIRRAGKSVLEGSCMSDAYGHVAAYNDALQGKGMSVIDGFASIKTQHPEVDFTRRQPPKKCSGVIEATELRMAADYVCSMMDGRTLFLFFHVTDAQPSSEAIELLLNAAMFVAQAKAINAEVALLDAPRRRLIFLDDKLQPEVVESALRQIQGKKPS